MHFSPRPNRAHEIGWLPWEQQAFERAQRENKPILLSISAVWCHWCHVMDETSYSDEGVITTIKERYVPVRVDNDVRPDVNARYNQGGWPTTAFLTPDGALLAGATYLPPEQMRQALEQIAAFYHGNREQIAQRAQQLRESRADRAAACEELRDEIVAYAMQTLAEAYDEEFGGFGDAPKFPMIDALEFLLQEFRATGDQRAYTMVAKTLLAMSSAGMYDHVEGGFFRYSTTRDWSVPHFEKMTEDHAGLLRLLAQLTRQTRNERFRETLVSALTYVRRVLRDPETELFAGSQDADETYYALPLEERARLQAPYVDRRVYANWNAAMAASLLIAGSALEDDRIASEGAAALDALHERMRDASGMLYHFWDPRNAAATPQVRGLLTDQAAYLRALLDAHEQTGESRFLDRARALIAPLRERFEAPDGGFYDHAQLEEALGTLPLRDRPMPENALIAESLLRLQAIDGEDELRRAAEATLRVFAATYQRAGIFAASYARVVRRFLSPVATVKIEGQGDSAAELREAAHALGDPLLVVHAISKPGAATAYYCRGATCAPPARTPAQLRDAYESSLDALVPSPSSG